MCINKPPDGELSYKIHIYDIGKESDYKYYARDTVVRTDGNFQMDMNGNRELFDKSILQLLQDILEFSLLCVEYHEIKIYLIKLGHIQYGRVRRLKVSNHNGKKYSRDLSILRQLATDKIDIGSTTILLTYDRIGMADYTIGIDTFNSSYVFVKNPAAENSPVTGINASRKQFSLNMLEQPSWDLSEVMLVTIGALSQQGADRHPNTMAARILFLVLFLLAVLMYTAYSASVISIMSSTKPVSNSLQGILESSSKMSVALHDIHYYHTQFQIERNPLSQNLHKLELVPEFLSLEEGLEGALEGNIAFSCGRVDAHTYLQNSQHTDESLCGLGEIPILRGMGYQRSFALKHNSPLRRAFDRGLLRLMEHGLIKREWHRYFGKRPASELHCEETSSSTGFVRITLDDVWPAVKMFGVGVIIAILLLPTELLVRQWLVLLEGNNLCENVLRSKMLTPIIK
uniref:Ionotropic receptor 19 n=1 Tax=Locusta migratoria TaxID=7004 RepID=A0A0M3SBL5_LOCMI|nr:ionotropic receptor 19 [Locusta migratoria]